MQLRRSLFVFDIVVLAAIFVFLVILPAERCMNFIAHDNAEKSINSKCHLHPFHHPDFSFSTNFERMRHLESVKHHFTVCHRLQFTHYTFSDQMYIIILPAITCLLLMLYTFCELFEFDYFVGTVQSTALVVVSIFTVVYTFGVILHEKHRIENDWPLRYHSIYLGAKPDETTVDIPKTWEYSILMCILSAAFKIGRILIQHFIGDKKIFLDDSTNEMRSETGRNDEEEEEEEIAGTTRMFNESRYSRIETD